jgi:hypothetical protein
MPNDVMPDDVITIAKMIFDKIKEIETERGYIGKLAQEKAKNIANYEKKLAITIISLKNGIEIELGGQKIKSPPVTIIEKIAKGICFEEKIAADLAEAKYKAHITKMECLMAEMNGLQSINRYLDQC